MRTTKYRVGQKSQFGLYHQTLQKRASLVVQLVKHPPAMQYPCLENPHGQKTLAGCSPWSRKELDTIEGLIIAQLQKNPKEYFGQPNVFLGDIYLKMLFLGIVLVVSKKQQLQNEKGTMFLTLLDRINVLYGEFTCINSLILHSVGMYELFSSFSYQRNLSVREINISNIAQLLKALSDISKSVIFTTLLSYLEKHTTHFEDEHLVTGCKDFC